LYSEIQSLPVQNYDLVINDFEPVSAWACYQKKIKCISLSHQAAVSMKNTPQPKNADIIGRAILERYAPSSEKYGFHFSAYNENIFTPVIRKQIREKQIGNRGYYTVYLPAYNDERILKVLSKCKSTHWQVFSKHNKEKIRQGNISIQPISNDAFIESMAASEGVLCGAGFETPAEALYLKKKLMVIPMKGQYEQQCNAVALKEMGVPVLKSLKKKHVEKILRWIESGTIIDVDYKDNTSDVIDKIFSEYPLTGIVNPIAKDKKLFSVKKFRNAILRNIVAD
jgi:uncharacterized protein (TIGR00661 family)